MSGSTENKRIEGTILVDFGSKDRFAGTTVAPIRSIPATEEDGVMVQVDWSTCQRSVGGVGRLPAPEILTAGRNSGKARRQGSCSNAVSAEEPAGAGSRASATRPCSDLLDARRPGPPRRFAPNL